MQDLISNEIPVSRRQCRACLLSAGVVVLGSLIAAVCIDLFCYPEPWRFAIAVLIGALAGVWTGTKHFNPRPSSSLKASSKYEIIFGGAIGALGISIPSLLALVPALFFSGDTRGRAFDIAWLFVIVNFSQALVHLAIMGIVETRGRK